MLDGTWYKSANWQTGDSGTVGGSINTGEPLTGLLDEIFPLAASRFIGRPEYERFCKIFFRNEGNAASDMVMFFADQEHPGQITFAFEKTPGDTGASPTGMPSGYTDEDFIEPIGLSETEDQAGFSLATNASKGVWLRQVIPDGLNSETGAVSRLAVAGDVV